MTFKIFLKFILCVWVFRPHTCMCEYHVHSVPTEARRGRSLGPPEQASQRVVTCHMGAGKWI